VHIRAAHGDDVRVAIGPVALTPREAEVLAAIGRRLTNPEIADELVLSVRTVESHVAALRRKLEVDSRPALVAAGLARAAAAVPLPVGGLVGRVAELAGTADRLAAHRLVTITGAAGCGKTRLAMEAAAQHSVAQHPAAQPVAVVVVELDRVEPAGVLAAVAAAVGVRAGTATGLLAAAALAMSDGPHLLVLDDCDRVAATAAEVAGALLGRVPGLRVLATSRSPLGAAGEAVLVLDPLPDDEAVRLFRDRAAAAAPGAALDDAETLTRICRRLDGLPLAIELAAARVRHLPPAELAELLDERLDVLGDSGGGSSTARHRTLDAAFAWSWDLLDAAERALLGRLAALPRSFDLALAEAVGGPGCGRVVLRLLDRSLLAPAGPVLDPREPRRFRLLDALRTFVLDRSDPADVAAARRAHAVHHAELAVRIADRIRTDDGVDIAGQARAAIPEITAALRWTIAHRPGAAPELAAALATVAEHVGPDAAALTAIADAARDPGVRARARATDLLGMGAGVAYHSVELLQDIADLALTRIDGPAAELAAHHLAGSAAAFAGGSEVRGSLVHLDRAARLADELDERWQRAMIHQLRGIALSRVDPAGALAAFAAAAEAFALAGDAMHVNNARFMMAQTAATAGIRRAEAVGWAEQSIDYARERGHAHELAHARLALAGLRPGPAGAEHAAAALPTFRAVGDLRCVVRCCLRLADDRPPGEAVALLEQALATAAAAGDRPRRIEVLTRLVRAHWARGATRDAAVAVGALAGLVGTAAAERACPPDLAGELDRWRWAVAEGRARTG
jgi:predicted ATPase/DNA-binding CsgD family transcriptional regulator